MALYRTYRPATFAEVVGQEHVTEPLSRALDAGRINHAYLFSGPRGCGKTSSARILARSLNCEHGPTSTPCGECSSCVALGPGGPGNLDVVELDAASHGGVDDTRELRDRAFYAPAESRYRVFVIDEAHMVTSAGFNALLKIVEEPPEHLIFIFATTEPEKVLTTIKSRTHHYPFRLLAPPVMRDLLESICTRESVVVAPEVYPLVIRAGGGSPRDSLSILDQLLAGAGDQGVTYDRALALLGVTDSTLIDDSVDALAAGDGAALFGVVERVVDAGHDPRRFAIDLLDRFRDLILLRAVPDAAERGLVEAPDDQVKRMRAVVDHLGPATLTRYAEVAHAALGEMRGTTSPRLLLEVMCSRMLLPSASSDDAALLQRIETLERRPAGSVPGAAQPSSGPSASAAPTDEAEPRFVRPSQRKAAEQARSVVEAAQSSSAQSSSTQNLAAEGGTESSTADTVPEPAVETNRAPEPTRPQAPVDRVPATEAPSQESPSPETPGPQVPPMPEPTPPQSAPETQSAPITQSAPETRPAPAPTAPEPTRPEPSPERRDAAVPPARDRRQDDDRPGDGRTGDGRTGDGQNGARQVSDVQDRGRQRDDIPEIPLPPEPPSEESPPDDVMQASPGASQSEVRQQESAPAAAGLTVPVVSGRWPDIRAAVRTQSTVLEAMLSAAFVHDVVGTDIVLGHPHSALVGRLSDERGLRVLTTAVGEVFGDGHTVSVVQASPEAASAPGQANAPVQQRKQTFTRPSRPREQSAGHGPADAPPEPEEPAEPEPPTPDDELSDAERDEMVAQAQTGSPDARLDPDQVALDLLKSELGARPVD
ncbi:DNA polymerase III subunit gamma and tau [Gordonia zhaorongruii]|uniref:DNA polymerase III subunit gamma and tau n=1 Tax=Gordonia zhaorongruii TaxID=2597659 RepID=UPI0010479D45|nr:DNA polymerase III subunit gamma and tau [Gordonia zhaorongruii]